MGIASYSFKPGLPQEFEILEIGKLYRDFHDALIIPHRTGFYHILWFQKGTTEIVVDFRPVKVSAGTILFLNKDCVKQFAEKGNFDGKVLVFTDQFFCQTELDVHYLRSSILFNDLLTFSTIDTKKPVDGLNKLFDLMQEEVKREKDAFQSDILRNLLHNFLMVSERERRKQGFIEIKKNADYDFFLLFRDKLESQFATNKQVGVYASQLNITEKRLYQVTTRILGKSPKEMIDDRVLLEAKRLLAHTTNSVKEIGFSLGFDEPTNFIKYFRKHCSETPADFRGEFLKS